MAKRRKRQPSVASQVPAAPSVRPVDPDLLAKSTPASHNRVRARSFAKGSARSAQNASRQDAMVARFALWAKANDFTIADHLVDDGHGRQHLEAWVVTTFLIELARPGLVTPTSLQKYRSLLLGGLKHLEVPVLVPDLDDEIVRTVARQLEVADPRPAAPVFMGYGLEEIRAELATEPDELWRAALLAFHLTAHWFGGRCVEPVCNLRWEHVTIDDEHMTVVWPPSKYQNDPKAVRVRVADLPDDLNPALALAELRKASAAAELDTTDAARIFPDRRYDSWSVTHVEDIVADRSVASDLTDEGRYGYARQVVGGRYRKAWSEYALQTAWASTVGHRRVSPHGLRRGIATLQARNGAALFDVAATLRHGEAMRHTYRYIDPHHADYQTVVQLLVHDAEPVQVPKSFTPDASSSVANDDEYDGPLPVLDWAAGCVVCGAKRDAWSAFVDDEQVVLCSDHLGAYSRGEANWQAIQMCGVWGVHNGEKHTCDRPKRMYFTLDDGTKIPACQRHRNRLAEARERDEELTLDPEVGLGSAGRSVGS